MKKRSRLMALLLVLLLIVQLSGSFLVAQPQAFAADFRKEKKTFTHFSTDVVSHKDDRGTLLATDPPSESRPLQQEAITGLRMVDQFGDPVGELHFDLDQWNSYRNQYDEYKWAKTVNGTVKFERYDNDNNYGLNLNELENGSYQLVGVDAGGNDKDYVFSPNRVYFKFSIENGHVTMAEGYSDTVVVRRNVPEELISVKDANGENVNNISFTLSDNKGNSWALKAKDGYLIKEDDSQFIPAYEGRAFKAAYLSDGSYTIKVNKDPAASPDLKLYDLTPFMDGTVSNFMLNNHTVSPSAGWTQITLPLREVTKISVKDKAGEDVDEVGFILMRPDQSTVALKAVGGKLSYPDGQAFIPEDLEDGEYSITGNPDLAAGLNARNYKIPEEALISFSVSGGAVDPAGLAIVLEKSGMPTGEAKLRVNKTDEKGEPLGGATFRLQSENEDSENPGPTVDLTFTIPEDGSLEIPKLPYGQYLLEETKAPEGYIKEDEPTHIFLGKDSSPSVGGVDVSDKINLTEMKWEPPHWQYQNKVDGNAGDNGVYATIYPNQAESFYIHSAFSITDPASIHPGDYFTIQLSPNITTHGITESKDQELDIYGAHGKLATGFFDREKYTITYTFTDLVAQEKIGSFNLHTAFFIDKIKVRDEKIGQNALPISYAIQGKEETSPDEGSLTQDFQVFYRPYYWGPYKGPNIGAMFTTFNPDENKFINYVYINPRGEKIKNAKLTYDVTGSALINDLTEVKVYEAGEGLTPDNLDKQPPSWGVIPGNLTEATGYTVNKNPLEGQLTVDFDNLLADDTQNAYIVQVTSNYDANSEKDLGMVAQLSGYYSGYYSNYNDNYFYDYGWSQASSWVEFYENDSSVEGTVENVIGEITLSNLPNHIEFTKVSDAALPLLGAEFELYKDRVSTGKKVISNEAGLLGFSKLEPGHYTLIETKAPEGYEIPKDEDGKPKVMASFTVEDSGEITDISPENQYIQNGNGKGSFSLNKTDENGKPLEGVTFKLTGNNPDGSNNSFTEEKTSDESGKIEFTDLPIGSYLLEETKTVDGYIRTDKTWTVTVEKEDVPVGGELTISKVFTKVEENTEETKKSENDPETWAEKGIVLSSSSARQTPLDPSELSAMVSQSLDQFKMSQDLPLRATQQGNGYEYENPNFPDPDDETHTKKVEYKSFDVDKDGKPDYKLTQTIEPSPDGKPGHYKVNVEMERLNDMELVILLENSTSFNQLSGANVLQMMWAGFTNDGPLNVGRAPNANTWLDYYLRSNESRINELLGQINKKYPKAKISLIQYGGGSTSGNMGWAEILYYSLPVDKAVAWNKDTRIVAFNEGGALAGGKNDVRILDNVGRAGLIWDEYYAGGGRTDEVENKENKGALELARDYLKKVPADRSKALVSIAGFAPFYWFDYRQAEITQNAMRYNDDLKGMQNISVNWLYEMHNAYGTGEGENPNYSASTLDLINGDNRYEGDYPLPSPQDVFLLAKNRGTAGGIVDDTVAWKHWKFADDPDYDDLQYIYQNNRLYSDVMEARYQKAIEDIAKKIDEETTVPNSKFRIQLAKNVLLDNNYQKYSTVIEENGEAREVLGQLPGGMSFNDTDRTFTSDDLFPKGTDKVQFSYYIKANSEATDAIYNQLQNINDPDKTAFQINISSLDKDGKPIINEEDGKPITKPVSTGIPVPQLSIPGWQNKVIKHWYGNSVEDDAKFNDFDNHYTEEPTAAMSLDKRKASQVLIMTQDKKFGQATVLQSPFEEATLKPTPVYDNEGNRFGEGSQLNNPYVGKEYHDPIYNTKTKLVQNTTDFTQTFYIGAQLPQEPEKANMEVHLEWLLPNGSKEPDAVDLTLEAYRGDTKLTEEEMKALLGENFSLKQTVKKSAPGEWPVTYYNNLPLTDKDKNGITYKVKEVTPTGFDTTYQYQMEDLDPPVNEVSRKIVATIIHQGRPVLEVTNEPNKVIFYKEDNEGNSLAGAKFTLQKKTSAENDYVDVAGYIDITTVKNTDTTSGNNGKEELTFEKLAPGDYIVNETQVPEGYKAADNPVAAFTVAEDGKIDVTKPDDGRNIIKNVPKDPMFFKIAKKEGSENGSDIGTGTLELRLTQVDGGETPKSKDITIDLAGAERTVEIPIDWLSGNYTLEETKAPSGFVKTSETYTIQINQEERKISWIKTGEGGTETPILLYSEDENDSASVVPLTIVNQKPVYPDTGGRGTRLFTMIGSTVMLLGAIFYRLNRERGVW